MWVDALIYASFFSVRNKHVLGYKRLREPEQALNTYT